MEIGERTWCRKCRSGRRIVDKDTDVALEGTISTTIEVTYAWIEFDCGHRQANPTGERKTWTDR